MSITLFISDLHISNQRQDTLQRLELLLKASKNRVKAIYVLGDLFDIWVGNDKTDATQQAVYKLLRDTVAHNTEVFVISGNRDIYLNKSFERATRTTVLPDEFVLNLYGTPTLLMHGDQLCTEDSGYQRYRSFMRGKFMRTIHWFLPSCIKKWIAHTIALFSKKEKTKKPKKYFAPNPQAIEKYIRHYHVQQLIHGHIHQEQKNTMSNNTIHYVLGDWDATESILIATQEATNFFKLEAACLFLQKHQN